jgi:hypothetical protein
MTVDTTPPVFTTPANSNVNENTAAGTVIYSAATSDATGVTYAITGGADAAKFSINATTGQVTMNFTPDYEAPIDAGGNNVYDYQITATDTAGNQAVQNASLTVKDVYEYLNLIFNGSMATPGWSSGTAGWTIDDNDSIADGRPDSNSGLTGGRFKEENEMGAIAITGTSGGLGNGIAMRNDVSFRLENSKSYAFSIDVLGLVTGHTGDRTANWVLLDGGNNIVKTIFSVSTTQLSDNGFDKGYFAGFDGGVFNFDLPTGDYKLAMQWVGSGSKDMFFDRVFLGVPPVVLDLNRDGKISYSDTAVSLNDSSMSQTTAWVGQQDGTLVWDKYHDGRVHDSSQYAFAQYLAGAKTDLEGLKAFDTNGNGQLDRGDSIWKEMRIWQDLNGDGVSDMGEVKTLAEWGIDSIGLTSDGVVATPTQGVTEAGKASASLADGSQMLVADVAFGTKGTVVENGVVARPFVLDLNHDGAISYGKKLIDIDGVGQKEIVAGISKADGVLIWNKYSDDQIHDASQYSFNSLKIFDTNGDGKLDSRDVLWKQLSVWQDLNGDGASEAGEVKTLSELGFKEINFVSDGGVAQPAAGVIEYGKASITMNDGSSMAAAQASFSLLDQTQWAQIGSAVI